MLSAMTDLLALGQRIRAQRKAAEMTQQQLAEGCGVDFTYISKIENGRIESAPSRDLLTRIADCLGDDSDVLIDLADQRTKAELRAVIASLRTQVEAADAVIDCWRRFDSYMIGAVPLPLWPAVLYGNVREAVTALEAVKGA